MKSYRIRTNLNDDSFIPININRNIDLLEILSLKIRQEDIYRSNNANYGVLVGRVTANKGFGLPNAKVSVFIPVDENEDATLRNLYPYETITDVNSLGQRYNLLPDSVENGKDDCYVSVGSFPVKRKVLDNKNYQNIHQKYYKFVTTTNESGDYLIMGIPLGNQEIHVDVDISDIGFLSIKPYDLIAQGQDPNLFASYTKFKASTNLDTLPQVASINSSKFIRPFWAQDENVAGINRLDLDLPITLTPHAYVFFGNFTDARKNAINKTCKPRRRQGRNCELLGGNGNVEVIRRLQENTTEIEFLDSNQFTVDDNGNAVIPVPMNLKRKVTDEFGNLVDSTDDSGIPTEANIRMKVGLTEYLNGFRRRTANYLIPNLYNNFDFNSDTPDRDFFTVKWKKAYTVANYIPRYQKSTQDGNNNFLGIKRIGECESNLSFPYNRINTNFNVLYATFCIIIGAIAVVVNIIDELLEAIDNLLPGDFPDIALTCNDTSYDDVNDWRDCVLNELAAFLNVVEYEFYNDFVIGSLYHPKFKFKTKFKRKDDAIYYKYCAYNCRETGVPSTDPNYVNKCKDAYIVENDTFDGPPDYIVNGDATEIISPATDGRGLIVEYNNEFFYACRHDVEINDPTTNDLNFNTGTNTTEKDKLLFATTLMPLGSVIECDIDGEPFFLNNLVNTTYQDEEGYNYLFNLGSLSSCIEPNAVQTKKIYVVNGYGVDIFTPDDDDTDDFYIDSEENDIRQYLCENFNPYVNNFTYNILNTQTITDDDGNDFEIITDTCSLAMQDANPSKNISPYFHYFGIYKGKTSLDEFKLKYLQPCN
jgi:hypothetical protein